MFIYVFNIFPRKMYLERIYILNYHADIEILLITRIIKPNACVDELLF